MESYRNDGDRIELRTRAFKIAAYLGLILGSVAANHMLENPRTHLVGDIQNKDFGPVAVQDIYDNSIVVQNNAGPDIYSCIGNSLIKDKFGPITASGSNIETTKNSPACDDSWLSAEDFPLTK